MKTILIFLSIFLINSNFVLSQFDIKNNIVIINNGDVIGIGFIIGEKNDILYIVTAAHVVKNAKSGNISLNFIENNFNCSADIEKIDNIFDVAILKCTKPIKLKYSIENLADLTLYNTCPASLYCLGNKSKLNKVECNAGKKDAHDIIYISSCIIPVGQSGMPVFSKMGIIGIITKSGGIGTGIGEALYIGKIKELCEENDIPFGEVYKSEKRYALLINNEEYDNSLPKCKNNLSSLEDSLKSKGFETEIYFNQNNSELISNLNSKIRNKSNYDVFLLYYSGLGYRIKNNDYIVPADFDTINNQCYINNLINIDSIITMNKNKYCKKIYVFDCGRDSILNSKDTCTKFNKGKPNYLPNSLVVFSNLPFQKSSFSNLKAKDCSLFADFMSQHITGDIEIKEIFNIINIRTKSRGGNGIDIYSNITNRYFFKN
jgi:hypothetical protein